VSRFLLPTFLCGRQRKVGAAPHRGNANKPITNQGKATAAGNQRKRPEQVNKSSKNPMPEAITQRAPRWQTHLQKSPKAKTPPAQALLPSRGQQKTEDN
jgi:hypothetical protein